MINIIEIYYGILIGIGMIMPGVSGSVIAIVLGVYDKIINIFNDNIGLINKIYKLFSYTIGILLGIFLFSNVLYKSFINYKIQITYVILGFIIGSAYNLIKKISISKIKFKYAIFSFLISLIILSLDNVNIISNNHSYISLFVSGYLYIFGKVIPGVSSSLILMLFGIYEYLLGFICNPFSYNLLDYVYLIPFFIGALLSIIINIKLIGYLLKNYYYHVYSVVIGLILSSVIIMIPGFEFNNVYIISIVCMLISFTFMCKINQK